MNRDDFIKIMVTADEMVKPMLERHDNNYSY